MATSAASRDGTSWTDLKSRIRATRRDLASLSSRIPSNFSFRAISSDLSRVYFLANLQAGRDTSLYYVDIRSDESSISSSSKFTNTDLLHLEVHPAIEVDATFNKSHFSREEELQLERKRWMVCGISHYEIEQKSGLVLFAAQGSLYCSSYEDEGLSDDGSVKGRRSESKRKVSEIKTKLTSARLNSVICPTNPELVLYVSNGNIWVAHIGTGQEVKLTSSHKGIETGGSLKSDPISAGLPSYVIQEEFGRYTGMWWRPVMSTDNRFTVLYEEVDDTDVDVLKFPIINTDQVDEFRFAKAGCANSRSRLRIVQFILNPENCAIVDVVTHDLEFDLNKYFPWAEYLVRAGWTPDGQFVWLQLLSRLQQHLEAVLIPVQSFVANIHPDPSSLLPEVQVIYSVRSGTWINVGDIFHIMGNAAAAAATAAATDTSNETYIEAFISSTVRNDDAIWASVPKSHGNQVQFITASEESGWKHLYLITASINGPHPDSSEDLTAYLLPHTLSKVALTQGQWCISDKEVWVDEEHGLVYFHGYRDTPLEKHLYVVSVNQPCNVVRLTISGYSHHAELNADCSLMVDVFSSIHDPTSCQLSRIRCSNGTAEGVVLTPVGWLHEGKPPDDKYQYPELFSHTISSGDKLFGITFKPSQVEEGQKYPVILMVYGGPEVQLVSNTFKAMRSLRNHMLAREGYYVISIDSRGSSNRGTAFESHLRHKMGQVELSDQIEVLNFLGSFTDTMDMDRVGIYGWSYGGYLSLIGLVTHPKLFKVCVAGAPVTCWKNYDTGYTERYMGFPSHNAIGYQLGSVVSRASEFPDEPDRLLIVHGLMDENVHFYHHTAPLLQALIKHGKPYQLQVYPSERHSLRRLQASEQYETTLLHFLKSNL